MWTVVSLTYRGFNQIKGDWVNLKILPIKMRLNTIYVIKPIYDIAREQHDRVVSHPPLVQENKNFIQFNGMA